ncbi:acyl carrier protein [Curtobacterium sp. 'Ferrero']|uniref:acyl carrier protein n=1 Tax=Curtobacterium sp. 'Ferrero' TaxID=2033654 RepID=UPI000BD61A1C|nr:acyl carrier protein [Curtobacterium sp. 'Ferrero']PCN46698.1 acyl carrier protein [Curtobacterium sp. 'Ferrero']
MDQDQQTSASAVALADPSTEHAVRRALADHGRLTVDAWDVASIADLYALGLTSHATVNVMLAVENELDVEFPDSVLTRSTFATVESIVQAAGLAA